MDFKVFSMQVGAMHGPRSLRFLNCQRIVKQSSRKKVALIIVTWN
jgi:hypothetical protein